ncbi:MAG: hypothetical protein HKN09_03240 [Saprospiraceae bacterium]|nr:hypothetical protein [Saprospiraceae bacterium]
MTQESIQNKAQRKGPLRFILRVVVLFFLLVLALPFIVHFGPVQKFLVNKLTKQLSEKTSARVDVGKVDFSVFKGLELEDIYISNADTPEDTLLYARSLSSSLRENLLSLRKKRLLLSEINADGVVLNIVNHFGSDRSNLDEFISRFSPQDADTASKSPLFVELRKLNLDDIQLFISDENKGEHKYISLDKGLIALEGFSTQSDTITLSNLMLSNPYVHLEKMPLKDTLQIDTGGKQATSEVSSSDQPTKFIRIHHLELSCGTFINDDWNYPEQILQQNVIDYKHLLIDNININADSTSLSFPLDIKSNIKSLTLEEKNGFEIQQLDVRELHFGQNGLGLKDFILKTKSSLISDQLRFNYNDLSDFKSFAESIVIQSSLNGSRIALSDLSYFFPDVAKSSFFKLNKNKTIALSGKISGTVDDLEADNISLKIGNQIYLNGSLSTSNLTKPDKALINLYVDELTTSLTGLKQVIPGFNPPQQFYKLDPISFSGAIDGFFNDFVIYGYLQSNLGRITLDTRLDVKDGINNALYSGNIVLKDFDLKRWTGNDNFGFATFSASIYDGQGLTLGNVKANLEANLENFEFKGYPYNSIILKGEFQKNLFDGSFIAFDPNVDLNFEGQIDLSDNAVKTDFRADIRNIDLKAINLSDDFSSVNGQFNCSMSGSDTKDFAGLIDVDGLSVKFKEKDFVFDSLYVSSSPAINSRNLIVSSDIINASLDGVFDFSELVPKLKGFIAANHPLWAKRLNIKASEKELNNRQDFRFKIRISDTRDYLELINADALRLKGVSFEGAPNLALGQIESTLTVDTIQYQEYTFANMALALLHNNSLSKYNLALDKIFTDSKTYDPVNLKVDIDGDVVMFNIATNNILDSIGNIDVDLRVIPEGDNLEFTVVDKKLQMFSSDWSIRKTNKVVFGDKYLKVYDFILTDGNRVLDIGDINARGLHLSLRQFDFALINGIINYDKINFTGTGNADIQIFDLFGPSEVVASAFLPEFDLNDVNYGALIINGRRDTTGMVKADIKMDRESDGQQLHVSVDYNERTKGISGNVRARNLVMNTFEFIIDDGISNTAGVANIDASIFGTADDIKLRGEARIKDGVTTINYLGAQIGLGTEKVRISENFIDLTNVSLFDKFGNRAVMLGGLRHKLFADFRTDLSMSSDRFLALDTEKGDNPMYYGKGIGAISVEFNGPFSSTDIDVTAVTGQGTILNIPVEDTYENFDESFIKFVDRDEYLNPKKDTIFLAPKIEGVDVEMNLTISDEAQVNMIFNERLNDVIKGRGNGDLRIIVSRQGDFNIFGTYEVESGDYLFTAWGIVAKPFTVKQGGLITWTGDPINANLNIETEYTGLRVPVNVFLDEYLTNASTSVQTEARKRTQVDLTMKLTGTLYNPIVNFDLKFPELQGELRTYADNKVRTLRENEADLNEQVAGLIMFRSFLPSNSLGDNLLTSESLTQTGYNTLSEFVSNQLSYLLSGFLQEALSENGFVSGIDFEIGFSRNSDVTADGSFESTQLIPDEIEVHFKPRFQNDKWGFDYGTSFVNSRIVDNTNYVIHDFVLEYYLTDDRRLKLRAYGKWDRDEVLTTGSAVQKYGLGINYRKEFGNLTDFKKALSKDISNIKSDDQGTQED